MQKAQKSLIFMPLRPGASRGGDLFNARRLVEIHGRDLRYAPELGRWFVWDGRHWAEDITGEIYRRAKDVVDGLRELAAGAPDQESLKRWLSHWARSSSSARINAMVDLARTEPDIPVLTRELDPDPHLLAVQNGVVDLHTGELLPHDPARMMTRMVGLDYEPGVRSGMWTKFLSEIFVGDEELIAYVQRCAGYSATSSAGERKLLIPWGTGHNGKSTLIRVIQTVLGPWATTAGQGLLVTQRSHVHEERIADLHRRRMVASLELEERRTLAEALVKWLTGNDPISARHLYRDRFTFLPTFTVWLVTNHKPRIRGTDEAIKGRVKLIPFKVTIPEDQRISDFHEALFDQCGPAVLAWIVEGAVAWYRDGIGTCLAVEEATAEYLAVEDLFARFLAEHYEEAEDGKVKLVEMWESWKAAMAEEDDRPGRLQDFVAKVEGRYRVTLTHTRTRLVKGIQAFATDNVQPSNLM